MIEFFLVTYASQELLGMLCKEVGIPIAVEAGLRAFGSLALGCVALVMNTHPFYKLPRSKKSGGADRPNQQQPERSAGGS